MTSFPGPGEREEPLALGVGFHRQLAGRCAHGGGLGSASSVKRKQPAEWGRTRTALCWTALVYLYTRILFVK